MVNRRWRGVRVLSRACTALVIFVLVLLVPAVSMSAGEEGEKEGEAIESWRFWAE